MERFTVIEHLEELRKRAISSLIMLGVATAASVPFASPLLRFLKLPASGYIDKLAFFAPEEAFSIYIRISFIAGLIVSFPFIIYQLWMFTAPAIEEKFKRYVVFFTGMISLAFLAGCAFAYLIMLPAALKFLLSLGQGDLVAVISASKYISFVTTLILISGLVFQMPVLSMIATKIGIMDHIFLRKKFMYAVIAIMILAAVITPTGDAVNMLILALPMILLYEVSIWVSWLAKFSKRRSAA